MMLPLWVALVILAAQIACGDQTPTQGVAVATVPSSAEGATSAPRATTPPPEPAETPQAVPTTTGAATGGAGPGPGSPASAQAGSRAQNGVADIVQRRTALDLVIIEGLADGGIRRSKAATLTWKDVELWADGIGRLTIQTDKNQPEPQTVAVTETTARALREIEPGDADPQLRYSG